MILNNILINNVKNFPNKPASTMQIGFRNFTLTYGQTYTLAQKVATLLEQQGVNKGDPVLICAPNSPFWTCVFWGCLLKGAVAVPLNIQSTPEIIKLIIKQTDAKVLFSYRGFKHQFNNLITYPTDLLDEILATTKIKFSAEKITKKDLVQIMYTSGTTSAPKGVMLTHENIYANLDAIKEVIHPKSNDKMLSILPLSHIYEQTIGFLLPYSRQVPVVYAHSHNAIRRLLKEHKITLMLAVPEFLQLFMSKIEAGAIEKGRKKTFDKMIKLSLKINQKWFSRLLFRSVLKQFGGKLTTIAAGGAPLNPELERKWNALGIDILQGYGLTETSPVITTNTYGKRCLGSVGKPLSNVQVKIDDSGQIWAKGPSVFAGYYKNLDKTNEVLKDGWFNTEDMGEFDDNGFLFIKGRKKYMIIGAGGQNVYPEDVEVALISLADVKDACVVGIKGDHGDKIHAVLILNENTKTKPAEIIDLANENLASYQQINAWSVWAQTDFPRTSTRKIKKNEVTKIIEGKGKTSGESVPQVSFSKLVKILAQVSGTSADNILPSTKIINELGLDSLARVELIGAIEEEMRIAISDQDIAATTTVSELEATIKNQKPVVEPPPLKRWPRMLLIRILRTALQMPLFAFTYLFMPIKVEGRSNLAKLKYPVIFMPNHLSYADPIALAKALPFKIRTKISFAAARDFIYEELKVFSYIGEILLNAFPVQRDGSAHIKLGLEHIGQMLDQGYSVVVFPEGKISIDGKLLPFKSGTGVIAANMFVQIVPVKIKNIEKVFPYEKLLPRSRTTVIVKFGKPMQFNRSDDPQMITQQIEEILKNL